MPKIKSKDSFTAIILTAILLSTFIILYAINFSHNVCPKASLTSACKTSHTALATSENSDLEPLEKGSDKWRSLFNDPTAFFTAVIALFTIGLFAGTYHLVLGAEDTAEHQLRAYVMIDAAEIRQLAANQRFEIAVRVKNFGQTPAKEVKIGGTISIGSSPDPSEPISKLPAIIPPGGEMYWNLPINTPLELAIYNSIIVGQRTIFLKGKIEYTDAFEKKRQTNFCKFYKGNGATPTPILALSNTESDNDYS